MVHTRCMLDKQGYTGARACTPTRTHLRARAHTHTHADKYIIPLFHSNNDSRRRLIVTLYVGYIACIVKGLVYAELAHRGLLIPRLLQSPWRQP